MERDVDEMDSSIGGVIKRLMVKPADFAATDWPLYNPIEVDFAFVKKRKIRNKDKVRFTFSKDVVHGENKYLAMMKMDVDMNMLQQHLEGNWKILRDKAMMAKIETDGR